MFIAAVFNGAAITVTRYSSAVHQVVIDQARVIVVWGFFLAYPGPAQETFTIGQLVGFMILLLGNLIYNEVIYQTPKRKELIATRIASRSASRLGSRKNSDDQLKDHRLN